MARRWASFAPSLCPLSRSGEEEFEKRRLPNQKLFQHHGDDTLGQQQVDPLHGSDHRLDAERIDPRERRKHSVKRRHLHEGWPWSNRDKGVAVRVGVQTVGKMAYGFAGRSLRRHRFADFDTRTGKV
jgi:hypothetical protein